MRTMYLADNKGIEHTLIYYDSSGDIKRIEAYLEAVNDWVDIPLTKATTNLWEKCQDKINGALLLGVDEFDLYKTWRETLT